uniref:Haloacid dehalogenase-like hydrolase domain-containing 5 n=1 Tax=Oryzias latipes TaxID=8090 RepID=A0A3P9LY54_ORYLA
MRQSLICPLVSYLSINLSSVSPIYQLSCVFHFLSCLSLTCHTPSHFRWSLPFCRSVGVLFDVDGVLLRGGTVIPAARRALRKLVDENNNFLYPVIFVTNAGSCQRLHKARQLSHLLDIHVSPEQVVLSHSPLNIMKTFHNKCVLVSGQGPVTSIAQSLGFQKVVTIEQLSQHHPLLDMVDHNRRPTTPVTIILFGEPVRWETNLQLLVDVLLTEGSPGSAHDPQPPTQLPILACNTDLLWMAEAPAPRFGHGMFLLCLEAVYRKLTGRELQYEALLGKPSLLTYQYAERLLRTQNHNRKLSIIYAVGDNLMTDVYGANLYNRYLSQQPEAMKSGAKRFVCTGVYNPHSPLPSDQNSSITEMVFHGQRDLVLDRDLLEPSRVVEDVEAAVDFMLQQESSDA